MLRRKQYYNTDDDHHGAFLRNSLVTTLPPFADSLLNGRNLIEFGLQVTTFFLAQESPVGHLLPDPLVRHVRIPSAVDEIEAEALVGQRECPSGGLLRVELTPLLVQGQRLKEQLRVVVFRSAPQDSADNGSDHEGHPMGFVFEYPLPVKQTRTGAYDSSADSPIPSVVLSAPFAQLSRRDRPDGGGGVGRHRPLQILEEQRFRIPHLFQRDEMEEGAGPNDPSRMVVNDHDLLREGFTLWFSEITELADAKFVDPAFRIHFRPLLKKRML